MKNSREQYGEIREICNRIREENVKQLKESEQLINRARLIHNFLKLKIEHDKEIITDGCKELDKRLERCIDLIKSNDINKKREAVKDLVKIGRMTKSKEELYIVRETLDMELKIESEVAEEILMGFFELYLYQEYAAPIVWAAKSHPSEKIRETAKLILMEISKIKKITEKEEWKRRFKEKIRKHRERIGNYNGFKEHINANALAEEVMKFKNALVKRLAAFVSINSLAQETQIEKKLEEIISVETAEKIFKATDGKVEMINIFDMYHLSTWISVLILRDKPLDEMKDEINSRLETELRSIKKTDWKIADLVRKNKTSDKEPNTIDKDQQNQ